MSDDDRVKQRRYRFSDPRRSGLFGSLAWTMLIPLTMALFAAWLAVGKILPWPVALPVIVIGGWLSFGRFRGRPAHAALPSVAAFVWKRLRHRHRWYRPVPLVTDGELPVALPSQLAGLQLYEADVTWLVPGRPLPMAVIHDRGAGTVTAIVRGSGDGQFSLLDADEQDMRLGGWGAVLGGFVREGTEVVRIAVQDWAAPLPVAEQIGRLEQRWADAPESPERRSYLRTMQVVAPKVTEHDVLVQITVTVPRKAKRGRTGGPLGAAISILSDELRLLHGRMETSGQRMTGVLSAAEVVTATRGRSDPMAMEQLATMRQSLAAAVGAAAPTFGPFHVDENLTSVRVDRSLHRTWWFARWPRREVPADWLDKLIFDSRCTRTVTFVFEPVPPSRSDRAVDKELVRREANIDNRQRRQLRVTGKDTKGLEEAQQREAELNAGFQELCFGALITLTCPNGDDEILDAEAAHVEQTAAQIGVELQALWGQQGAGWVASLPLGRTLAQRVVPA